MAESGPDQPFARPWALEGARPPSLKVKPFPSWAGSTNCEDLGSWRGEAPVPRSQAFPHWSAPTEPPLEHIYYRYYSVTAIVFWVAKSLFPVENRRELFCVYISPPPPSRPPVSSQTVYIRETRLIIALLSAISVFCWAQTTSWAKISNSSSWAKDSGST